LQQAQVPGPDKSAAMRVGVILNSAEPAEGIARCRALGVDCVGLMRDALPGFDRARYAGVPDGKFLRSAVQQYAEAGIQVAAVAKPYCMGKDPDIVLNPARHRREIDEMLATIMAVADAGVPTMLQYVHVALPEDPGKDAALWSGVRQIFRECVRQAESSRLRLANHGRWPTPDRAARKQAQDAGTRPADYRRFRIPGWEGPFLIRDGEHIARLIEREAPSPYNGVCMCTGMYMNGTDVFAAAARFKGKVFFAQPRDLRGRWPQVEEVMPGEGEIDLPRFLRLLAKDGYTGMVHPEHFEDTRRNSPDPEADAVQTVKRWVAEATHATPRR